MLSKDTLQTTQICGRNSNLRSFAQRKELTAFHGFDIHKAKREDSQTKEQKSIFASTLNDPTQEQIVMACQHAMCTNEQVRDYFDATTWKDLINSKICTFNQRGAMQQPAIFPALVLTTRLTSYLKRSAPVSTTKLISYLKCLYSHKPPLPKKTRAQNRM